MQKSPRNFLLWPALWAVAAIAPAGCSPGADLSTGEDAPFVTVAAQATDLASLPAYSAAATVTPAPGGFVPGDSLPTPAPAASPSPAAIPGAATGNYRELTWEELVPPGYRPEDIMAKYQDELASFQDGDPAAMELYTRMQEEFNNAPINTELNALDVKLPGFIAPLEFQDGLITEFLLVPYFGACIHVPPPPVNQTVYISLAEGNGIIPEDAYYPVWVQGHMTAEGMTTDIGVAGYSVRDAVVMPYVYETP